MTRKQELEELKSRCCTKCKSGYIRGSDYNGHPCYVGCKDEIIDVQKIGFYCSEFIAQEDDYEDQWVYKYELNGKGEVLHG